ncbi:MAG: NUDIX domain-containing protein [Acidimicrobiales bacterium]
MGGGPGGFRSLGEAEVYHGHVFRVAHARFADPDGTAFERDLVRHPGAVAVVPVHADGSATLVRQMRVAVGTAILEVPAGTCDVDGEPPEATARRELAEEAGLRAGRVEPLIAVYNSPGFCDQRTTIFLATELDPCQPAPAGVEERWMSVERVALADIEPMVAGGQLVDETTVLGLLLARAAIR